MNFGSKTYFGRPFSLDIEPLSLNKLEDNNIPHRNTYYHDRPRVAEDMSTFY